MHIHRGQRKAYHIPKEHFSDDGRLRFTDYNTIRGIVHRINSTRSPSMHIYPGELRASSLLQEAGLLLLKAYQDHVGELVFEKASSFLQSRAGKATLLSVAEEFVTQFPPTKVYEEKMGARQYLQGSSHGENHLEQTLRNAMILSLANENPANRKQIALFDKAYLTNSNGFDLLIGELESFFARMPPFGPDKTDLYTMLRAPFRHAPDDFFAQLDYILSHWKDYLPSDFREDILQGKDMMKEDIMLEGHPGATPTFVPDYLGKDGQRGMHLGKSGYDAAHDSLSDYEEAERFTEDTHWMPRVVLIAKNTYVWLDQLSKTYQRNIRRLDQIPDEELDRLAARSFNGLWLIGIWERSNASRKIKHLMGNPDAISSAYALYDYEIAQDLGGEQAYHDLNERAKKRGIRLASDMVPNHTGVYSKWVIEHPDYFIQSNEPPFPNYSFTGENLSEHPGVEVRIEDGYYNKTDAAVVFQRIDRQNNDVRYIYHGNDGTMMPWNDTAQLDMIKAEVREAVMQKIFHVARRFSIIRFDAAMTLAKKHFARLWYPRPGTGGDIPSRAQHAMSKKAFDALFPEEFWRELVDRINNEMPETLLLAEAFWFMEGYFVRTLGMHRVYNSAFMHMLKNEENEKYRDLITNTLEFEPEILKRYVNFMSNPDEETAFQQFGTGDKYFGICVMMNTLPGLPMFAHGQIEGFTEKYGMEYQRAYYNERPNHELIARHEKEIFPLTAKRHLFSEVRHFRIYDFITSHGQINENVFAYTNRHKYEKALVLFNNTYDMTEGRIHRSAPRLPGESLSKELVSSTLGDDLGMKNDPHLFYQAREHISGMEYLFSGKDIHGNGLFRHLQGFEYRVFLDFYELYDENGQLRSLYERLQGQGTESLQLTLDLERLKPLHNEFRKLFDPENIQHFTEKSVKQGSYVDQAKNYRRLQDGFLNFARMAADNSDVSINPEGVTESFTTRLESIAGGMMFLTTGDDRIRDLLPATPFETMEDTLMLSTSKNYRENTVIFMPYLALDSLDQSVRAEDTLFEKLLLDYPLGDVLAQTGHSWSDVERYKLLIRILKRYGNQIFDFYGKPLRRGRPSKNRINDPVIIAQKEVLRAMLSDTLVREYLGVNRHEGIWYYSKEAFEQLCSWLYTASYFSFFRKKKGIKYDPSKMKGAIRRSIIMLTEAFALSDQAGYQLEKLSESLKEE